MHFSITKWKERKITTTTVIKNEKKYFPMWEGNTCNLFVDSFKNWSMEW